MTKTAAKTATEAVADAVAHYPRRIIEVDPRKLVRLEKNARFMPHEEFARLVANVRRDGFLDSTPLVCLVDEAAAALPDDAEGKWIVLSGNHRTLASIEAELPRIHVIAIDAVLPRAEFVARQLSHNAIAGLDDPATLRALYEEIDAVDWKLYAGLDDRTLQLLKDVKPEPLGEVSLDYQTVSIVFLPHEREAASETWKKVRGLLAADEVWGAYLAQYDRTLDLLDTVGSSYGVTNLATVLQAVLALVDHRIGDLQAGFLSPDGDATHERAVPVSVAIGALKIPAPAAAVVTQAIKAIMADGEIDSPAKALELLAADYLAGRAPSLNPEEVAG